MSLRIAGLALIITAVSAITVNAQLRNQPPKSITAPPKNSPQIDKKTTVSLVLLTEDNTGGLQARLWNTTLQKLGARVQIRRGTSADKIDTRESSRGTFRMVTVTGKLDRRGRLVFAERTFAPSETAKLTEWIRELQTYGAQGEPTGKPLWGLSKSQFGEIHTAMSKTVADDVSGSALEIGIAKLGLPREFPLRYSVAAKKELRSSATIRKQVKGHSLGTALALILRDHGLGFRPVRTPNGSIELVVDPLSVTDRTWPVGWDPPDDRTKAAPKMFRLIPVELDKVKFLDVLNAITVKTGTPIHLDYYATAAKGIDADKLVVSYERRMTSWNILLRGISSYHKMSSELRLDEAGKPFYWISTFDTRRSKSSR